MSERTPEQLRQQADLLESKECTGLGAAWCPIHGDCLCPNREQAMDDYRCPLHSYGSSHAAGPFQ